MKRLCGIETHPPECMTGTIGHDGAEFAEAFDQLLDELARVTGLDRLVAWLDRRFAR